MLSNLNIKINKLKEVIIRFKIYEELDDFQILFNQLTNIVEKLENLEIENENKITTQV